MPIEKWMYKAISEKAVRVLGSAVIRAMSTPQIGLLNRELDWILERHQSVDTITDAEIEGAYEMIVCYALPTGSHEHLLPPSEGDDHG